MQVKTFYSKVPGAKIFDSENGLYSFPCSSVPVVSFSWGGAKWPITAAKFVLFFSCRFLVIYAGCLPQSGMQF